MSKINSLVSTLLWILIGAIFCVEVAMRSSPNVMGSHIVESFSLTYQKLGFFSAAFYYAYSLMQIPSGWLLMRFGIKRTLISFVSIFSIGLFVLTSAQTYLGAVMARALMGVGASVTFASLLRFTKINFSEDHYAVYVGIANLFGILGALLSQYPLEKLLVYYSWREVVSLFLIVMICLLSSLAYLPYSKEGSSRHKVFGFSDVQELFMQRNFLALCSISVLMLIPISIIPQLWGKMYLMSVYDINEIEASLMLSCVYVGVGCGGPMLGYISRWYSIPKIMGWSIRLEALFIFLLTLSNDLFSIFFTKVCLFFVGCFSSGLLLSFTYIQRHFDRIDSVAVSSFNMMLMFLASLSQPLIGLMIDRLLELGFELNTSLKIVMLVLPFILILFAHRLLANLCRSAN